MALIDLLKIKYDSEKELFKVNAQCPKGIPKDEFVEQLKALIYLIEKEEN